MTESATFDETTLRRRLPLTAVLGFRPGPDLDWPRLWMLQHRELARLMGARIAAHGAGAVLAAIMLFKDLPIQLLGLWLTWLGVSLYIYTRRDAHIRLIEKPELSAREARSHLIGSILLGIGWGSLMPMLHLVAGPTEAIRGLVIGAGIAVGGVILMGVVPLSAYAFLTLLTLGACLGFWLAGHFEMLVSVVFFSFFAFGSIWLRAHDFLRFAIAETALLEKTHTVSLLLREFEENEADWLWQIDKSRRVRSVSPRFAYALGQRASDLESQPFFELISGEQWESGNFAPSLHQLADRIRDRESFSNLLVEVKVAGAARWWELSGTPILGEKGEYLGYRGVGSDVTEQRNSSEKIAYLARYDTLTGLPNRIMLHEELGNAMEEARRWRRRCAFIMVDLDRFKAVNDSLGHQVGDRLLEEVSQRLGEIGCDNAVCFRLGGDEFGIVIRDASEHGLIDHIARTVIERLSRPYEIDRHTVFVGASAGSALAPGDGKTVEELMRNADLALYRAKDDGRGVHYAYEPSLHANAEERRQLELSLRKAIEKDELLLHFQPVVDATSEEVVGFEALVRWQSEDHGFVSPGKFIPVAEDTRLIVPIGTWVMQRACAEAMAWPSHVKVNINVSPEQLVEPDFVDTVVEALSRSGLDPTRLEIEVTESIFLSDAEVAREALSRVMALGCQVALDDFGTGYSSLGYLRKLKFSTIKVDRSFVQGAAQGSSESLAIVRAVVAMAQSLEMKTTAEGVETEEEATLVRRMGCDRIQGFYFGRPMTSVDARSLFDGGYRAMIA
ncbi:putative bifunctional diguanylate cyclase/phosphodiesterase [Alteriqipengyuania lutimaris]|uniref:EAL domain-containing protein n=1 Tax=Alteriqipengyuania lutimaris TaxID=1538146 RepID=A0A395LLP9_9SPHN|nr:EAL domain-containing protein [Alteriqipengyuania lutimaris]MBB3033262.1 diguanylate cyclase (GGDEF)-like protein/PAS domain S-box-containing protein [Alteriqipengyuania lutimaris]RDS77695.1 EAL domain-containing protein [Alteriqipengyuania lutimaris]